MTLRTSLGVALLVACAIACSTSSTGAGGSDDTGAEVEPDESNGGDGEGSGENPIGNPVSPTPEASTPRTPPIEAGALSTCQSPRVLGTVKGDLNGTKLTAKGGCSDWLQVRVTEDSSAGDPMRVKITLVPDSTVDFDLYVYRGADANAVECSTPTTQSAVSGTSIDVATLEWGENGVPNGSDDDRTLSIEVRPKNPSDCTPEIWDGGGYSRWTLLVQGNLN